MIFPEQIVEMIKSGGIVVIPTDTLYGIVCSARSREAVEKLYILRGRVPKKPCIILVSDASGLEEFGITLSSIDQEALENVWPGKVSVVFDCPEERFAYLHRETGTIAFRVPDDEDLRSLLRQTGPLLAPSANPEGQPPARTVVEARVYFGEQVGYVDGGFLDGPYSTVARLVDGKWEILREGAVKL